eukprot:m.77959 g.77959  ORF g.77959 m.77959 type:complete len:264 (+) comp25065_c0_seq1:250-1041(+)
MSATDLDVALDTASDHMQNVIERVMNKFKSTTPVKYLGKLYVDRHQGNSLDQFMIQKVVKIIRDQAPSNGKVKTHFIALPQSMDKDRKIVNPACLVCFQKNGVPLVKTAILNILSIGRIGTMFYYVTAGIEMVTHNRYWVRAFDCKSKEEARQMCHQVMEECNGVQPNWRPKKGTQLSLLSATSSQGSAASGLSVANSVGDSHVQAKKPTPAMLAAVKSASQHALWNKRHDVEDVAKSMGKVSLNADGQPSKNLDDYLEVMDV